MRVCRPHWWRRSNHNPENFSENILLTEMSYAMESQIEVCFSIFNKKFSVVSMASDNYTISEILALRIIARKLKGCRLYANASSVSDATSAEICMAARSFNSVPTDFFWSVWNEAASPTNTERFF